MRHRTQHTAEEIAAALTGVLGILDRHTPVENLPADTRQRIADARDLADQAGGE